MKEKILQRAMNNGIRMADGRHWIWCGHELMTNKRGLPVRVEIWSSSCRWCGAEFQIKQKLLWGKPAYNFQTQNCPEHRGQRAPMKRSDNDPDVELAVPASGMLPDDGSDLV